MALVSESGGGALVDYYDPMVRYEREVAEASKVRASHGNPFAKPMFATEEARRQFQQGPFMRALRESQVILRERCAARDAARAARDPGFAPREED